MDAEKAQPQQQNPWTPPGPPPIEYSGFSTLNTNSARPGIKPDEMWWSDGFMPVGPNFLRTLPGIGPPIYFAGQPFGPPEPPSPTPSPPVSNYLWVAGTSCEAMRWNLSDTGATAPEINIQGTITTLTGPRGSETSFTYAVITDPKGNVYVFNSAEQLDTTTAFYIPIFAPGATGNIAPMATIQGNNTGFGPSQFTHGEIDYAGLCLDPSNKLYVGAGNSIYQFPFGASGNATSTLFLQDASIGTIGTPGISSLFYDWTRSWIWMTFSSGSNSVNGLRAYDLSGNKQRDLSYFNTNGIAPIQVSIDPQGNIWVTAILQTGNFGPVTIYKFSPSADAAANPIATLTGSYDTGGNYGAGLAITDTGTMFLPATTHATFSVVQVPAGSTGSFSSITQITSLTSSLLGRMLDGSATFPQSLFIGAT